MNKKRWRWVISIVVVIAVIVGGKLYMDHKAEQDYMIKVVKSDEANKLFEDSLKDIDNKALTEDGVIKSYKIDYNSITHNPMGGIDVTLIVNANKNVNLEISLDKYSGKLEAGSMSLSPELVKIENKIKGSK